MGSKQGLGVIVGIDDVDDRVLFGVDVGTKVGVDSWGRLDKQFLLEEGWAALFFSLPAFSDL